jgi:A/G-specific adenine glycosylase
VALHAAAEAMVVRHQGQVPRHLDQLTGLPGIGQYTARAVMAFAFETDAAVVDTNVGRVLARAVAGTRLTMAGAQQLADALLPPGEGWAHNQAMLDIGAVHCAARPRCPGCPLRRSCRWAGARYADPDPAHGSAATSRAQTPFAGSDRQGRGRLVAALRGAPVARGDLAPAAGWPEDPARARLLADALVADGLARWGPAGSLQLA